MIRRAAAVVALVAAVAAAPLVAGAQAPGPAPAPARVGRIAGHVRVADTDVPLGYAVVSIPALGLERFADAGGGFVLGGLPPGPHRLRVRRVGFQPYDTLLVVAPGTTPDPVRVGLRRLAVRLAAVRIRERPECTVPGLTHADSALAAVVDQLQQNAERARLLARRHPHASFMERVRGMPGPRGTVTLTAPETLIVTSARDWRYRPGTVVTRAGPSGGRGPLEINLPILEDFADSTFRATHCFVAAGTDTLFGGTYARVDVLPWTRLKHPDVRGALYLDTATYQIRWSVLELSRVPREVRGVRGVRMTAQFQEVLPSLPILAGARGDFEPTPWRGARDEHALSEEHRLLHVRWTGTPP